MFTNHMRIIVHEDPQEFRATVGPCLLENEAENCLGLGIVDTLITQPERYPKYYLVSLHDGISHVGAAWMTPPHPLGLTALPRSAIPLLVDYARSLAEGISSVVGPKAAADEFKDAWVAVQGCSVSSVMAQRIFKLERVLPPRSVSGALRPATEKDRALLEDWSVAFVVDCGLRDDRQSAIEATDHALKNGNRYLWELGGEAVSMVGFGGKTPSGMRINWVYTPPSHRGHGYASAAVATMSQKLLDEGNKYCFLYTDLANPSSNSIYQRIGYRPVCDSMHYSFGT